MPTAQPLAVWVVQVFVPVPIELEVVEVLVSLDPTESALASEFEALVAAAVLSKPVCTRSAAVAILSNPV